MKKWSSFIEEEVRSGFWITFVTMFVIFVIFLPFFLFLFVTILIEGYPYSAMIFFGALVPGVLLYLYLRRVQNRVDSRKNKGPSSS